MKSLRAQRLTVYFNIIGTAAQQICFLTVKKSLTGRASVKTFCIITALTCSQIVKEQTPNVFIKIQRLLRSIFSIKGNTKDDI